MRQTGLSLFRLLLPLGAVRVAGMAFVVGLSVLEDEAAGPLQPIGTLFHTVWTVLEMKAFHTMLWALSAITIKEKIKDNMSLLNFYSFINY